MHNHKEKEKIKSMKNWMVLIIEVSLLIFMCCGLMKLLRNRAQNNEKHRKTSLFDYMLLCTIPYFILHAFFTYDVNGYLTVKISDYWEGCVYQTVADVKYLVNDNRFINLDNDEEVYEFEQVYLDRRGNLVIDDKGEYKRSSYNGVYINSKNERLYGIDFCYWDIFGNIVLPEGRGFYINDTYYKLIRYDFLKHYDDFFTESAETFECVPFIIFGISVIIYAIFALFGFLMGESNKGCKVYKLFEKMAYYGITMASIFGCAMIQMGLFSINHHSFIKMFIEFIVWTIILKKIVFPYEAGSDKLYRKSNLFDYDGDDELDIIIAYDIYEEKDVNKYMKIYFVVLAIYVIMWIAFSINICNGRI